MLEEGSLWGPLILQVILLFINAVFASAEIAVISMNDNRIAKLTLEGDKRAIRLTTVSYTHLDVYKRQDRPETVQAGAAEL